MQRTKLASAGQESLSRSSSVDDAVSAPSSMSSSVASLGEVRTTRQNGSTGEAQQIQFAEKRTKLLKLIEHSKSVLDDLRRTPDYPKYLRYPHPVSNSNGHSFHSRQGEFSVLRLDLLPVQKSASSPAPVAVNGVEPNEDSYISQLLMSKVHDAQTHLDRLFGRLSDIRSRVLVTGDLNAGKSTFVNAMLRREIVPDDQQPCTALFCEVIDAEQNDGVEEVHGIKEDVVYDRLDPTTFTRLDLSTLRDVVEENVEGYELLKVYCRDKRPKKDSLLHNGIVDISLIDSPGLNIDSMKTTALFAQQEEIDVIVFVVNAENHFTLSGRQFLQTAGKEKAYIFIVVNRFDQIRKKDRCKRDILQQIQEISPLTYEDAGHLVHFVAAKHTLQDNPDPVSIADFTNLEQNLRSFILEKRSRSKLAPAKIYLKNLLSDVTSLCYFNHDTAEAQSRAIAEKLIEDAPSFERMLRIKEQFLDNIDRIIDETGDRAQTFSQKGLQDFADNIDACGVDIEWRGILGIWQYARDLRNSIYRMAAIRLRKCEEYARQCALTCVKSIEELAASCMEKPPKIDLEVVSSVFEDGSQEAGRAAAATMFIPLELNDFFAFTDKVAVAKEYVPGLAMIVGGLMGYQAVLRTFTRGGIGLLRGKVGFAGLATAGIGLFLYTLSDMKSVIDRQVIGKMKSHLLKAGLVEGNVERISRGTRRVLRLAIWEFQSQFQRILKESEANRREQTELRTRAEITKDAYKALAARSNTLSRMVEEIDL